MVAGFEQRPWTPTVRKGPIAAETATPGPAAVTLPTLIGTKVPDSRKHAAPAFTFGQKHKPTIHSLGEGPAKYNVTGLGNKGKDTPPAASLQSRHKEASKFSTPAPGEYDIQKATKAINQSTPKYTFGQKLASEKSNTTPGPNHYRVVPLDVIKTRAPQYTFRIKFKVFLIDTPAPNSYRPERVSIVKRNSPRFTFGRRTKIHFEQGTPAPGHYHPENYKPDHSPAYTFGLKTLTMPALPRGTYVEDRIMQRRERRMKSPVRNVVILENGVTQQAQQELLRMQREQQQNTNSIMTTTTTVTEVHTVNGNGDVVQTTTHSNTNAQPKKIGGDTVSTTLTKQTLINGKDTVDTANNKLQKLKMMNDVLTTGSNTQVTQKVENINGHNGESGKIVTTTVHTSSNGYKEEGNKKIQAQGSADVQHSKAASGSCNTTVSADGTTVTTMKSAKSSSVKYAVEASTVQEEIISS